MPRPAHITSPLDSLTTPIGVADFDEAAALLDVAVAEVERASRRVKPWEHADGCTRYWSVAQLGRAVAHARGKRPLTREEALAARELAAKVGITKAAKKIGRSHSTIYTAWRRYSIPSLSDRQNRGRSYGAIFSREEAETMRAYLAEHGPTATAPPITTTQAFRIMMYPS